MIFRLMGTFAGAVIWLGVIAAAAHVAHHPTALGWPATVILAVGFETLGALVGEIAARVTNDD